MTRPPVVLRAGSSEADGSSVNLRAAQYVRMSTDHQKYSTHNQEQAIAAYAAQRSLTIIRTYEDKGRSGLRIFGRDGLKQLIDDVQLGRAEFNCVLVYDVSRWGRFQDVDESAYYEFICKKAGIQVHYCAEDFENDGSLASTILKTMKRAGAADFSRQLSAKVFIGQCHIIELGFWHGGQPGYGLRRQVVDEHGVWKGRLEYGQQKYLQTDRVVLKPGPASEVKTVRRIFRSFASQGKCVADIALELNADQLRTSRGNPWTGQAVDKILANEKYIGNVLFNRASRKLQQRLISNPPEMWIRRNNALKPIIAPEIFAKAQQIISERRRLLSDQEALDRLSGLWKEKGHLSNEIILAAKNIPDTTTYIRRFGSLTAAYELIGFQPQPRYRRAANTAGICSIREVGAAEIMSQIEKLGGTAAFDPKTRLLTWNNEITVSLRVAWSVADRGGFRQWRVGELRRAKPDLALLARMTRSNDRIMDYYLIPTVTLPKDGKFSIASRCFAKAQRHDRLEPILQILTDRLAERR
jgi:DNA invertase Pin-like site-specific DNA recombinase